MVGKCSGMAWRWALGWGVGTSGGAEELEDEFLLRVVGSGLE